VPKEGAVAQAPLRHEVPRWSNANQKHVDAISRALKKAKSLFLATDPDREGEAHFMASARASESPGRTQGQGRARVVFYEITENAVREAMASPRGCPSTW